MTEFSAHPTAPRRLIWPWVLGAVLVLTSSVLVFIASFVVSDLAARLTESQDRDAVAKTVIAFDAAYEDQDCLAFRALVNEDLADQLVDGGFGCAAWVEIAESLRVGGEYRYSVEVLEVRIHGDEASVYTEESAGESSPEDYYYTLERSNSGWYIVAYGRT